MKAVKDDSELVHPGDHVITCNGGWLRSYARDGATIMELDGEIDACNSDQLSEHVFRYAGTAVALVVDTSAIDFLSVKGLRDLIALDNKRHDLGIQWTLIAGEAVRHMLKACGVNGTLPVSDSISAALQSLTIATIGYRSGG